MKISILLLLATSILTTSFAIVHTVSNNPNYPAQFTQVDPAIAAAAAGDTIYVYGSLTTYNDFTITKRLVLIGAGYNSNNQFKLSTSVGTVFFYNSLGNADGSAITGFEISEIRIGAPGVNNVTLFRNRINGSIILENIFDFGAPIFANGWIIYNNIINRVAGGIPIGNATSPSPVNTIIQNNIIKTVEGFAASSTLIDHNIFLGPNNLTLIYNATITNNIFIRSSGNLMSNSVTFNTFSNNLSNRNTIGPIAPTDSFASNENTASGNLINVDPQLENVTNLDNFDYNFNYRLRTGSPARNASTTGTDLGIYAAPYPFPSGGAPGSGFDTSALPPIPQITEMTIQNATVQPGAPLNVNVKARVNN
jgi:hypothetical protein